MVPPPPIKGEASSSDGSWMKASPQSKGSRKLEDVGPDTDIADDVLEEQADRIATLEAQLAALKKKTGLSVVKKR